MILGQDVEIRLIIDLSNAAEIGKLIKRDQRGRAIMRPCRNGIMSFFHIVAVQIIVKFGKGGWLMPMIGNGPYDLAFGKCLLVKRHACYSKSFVQF